MATDLITATELAGSDFDTSGGIANEVFIRPRVARLRTTANQNIINTGFPWNTIGNLTAHFDYIGLAVTVNSWTVPFDGVYQLIATMNYSDNNSARVNHRLRYQINGGNPPNYAPMQGSSYQRDSSGHDEAASTYSDIYELSAGDTISIQAQSTSSGANTTIVLANTNIQIFLLGRI